MKIKKLIFPIFCVLMCFTLLTAANFVLTPKNHNYYKYRHILYDDDKEIVNVGFFGGSHAFNAFCPAAMYYTNGIKAYNYSSSGQPFPLTYYLMKEVIQTQKLEVAVVDLYYLGMSSEYFAMSKYMRSVIDNLNMSQNKIDAINNCVAPSERSSYYIKFLQYHSRWPEVTFDDFLPSADKVINYGYLGWNYNAGEYGEDITKIQKTEERAEIPAKNLYYLNSIMELCEQNNIKLVFTSLPHDYAKTVHPDSEWVEDEQAMFNTVSDIAAEKDIPFIQFNNILDEIGFKFKTDMYNSSHTELSGSLKISKYIASFISESFELSDLSDVQSDTWKKYYNNYKEKFESQQ